MPKIPKMTDPELKINSLLTDVTPAENAQVLQEAQILQSQTAKRVKVPRRSARLANRDASEPPEKRKKGLTLPFDFNRELVLERMAAWKVQHERGNQRQLVFSDCEAKLPANLQRHVLIHGSKIGINLEWRLSTYMLCFELRNLTRYDRPEKERDPEITPTEEMILRSVYNHGVKRALETTEENGLKPAKFGVKLFSPALKSEPINLTLQPVVNGRNTTTEFMRHFD